MGTKRMNIKEGILDALIDDGESIIQVEEYLSYLGIEFKREMVKQTLVEFLKECLVEISYPLNKSMIDFECSQGETIEDFWFELTEKGRKEWEKIDY